MDEQSPEAAARRRSLQMAKQTVTTMDFQEPNYYTNSTATSTSLSTSEDVHWIVKDRKKKVIRCHQDLRQDKSSPVGQKLQKCRRTQDTSQDDSPSSRSPEDVPSKSYGPMDITATSTDRQQEFQRKLEFQSQRHSVRMLSPRGGDQANGRDNPVTSSAKPNQQLRVSSEANCYHEVKY
ncbi:hypothetical protein B9Z55_024870 [Caenorhabditis nigoni]|uniref:Uncharacterized protein n=1 Tax=Caenorhabditis nigoni TaxID=1611254 RepID=A0A2G5SWB5_9PELO|nr:hypothetical protein B9Z55_024870 [Caenorhabditis nigoni]